MAVIYIVNELDGKKSLLKNPTIAFDGTKVNGNAGCNSYSGKVVVDDSKIKFEQLMTTKMYCGKFMQIETKFLKVLANATHFKIIENQFLLYNKSNVLLLVGTEKE